MYGFLFDLNKKGEGEILIQNVDICGPEAIFFRQIVEKTQPTFLCNIFLYKFFSEHENWWDDFVLRKNRNNRATIRNMVLCDLESRLMVKLVHILKIIFLKQYFFLLRLSAKAQSPSEFHK